MMLMIKTVMTAAEIISTGKSDNKLQDLVKEYRAHTYPENKHDLEDVAKRHEAIMKSEFAKGPMKVQAQEYGKKRKQKRR